MQQAAATVKEEEIEQVEDVTDNTAVSTATYQQLQNKHGIFANSAEDKQTYYTIENDMVIYKISNKGGFIKSVQLKDYESYDSLPLIIFNPETTKFGLEFFC